MILGKLKNLQCLVFNNFTIKKEFIAWIDFIVDITSVLLKVMFLLQDINTQSVMKIEKNQYFNIIITKYNNEETREFSLKYLHNY